MGSRLRQSDVLKYAAICISIMMAAVAFSTHALAACGRVTIADMNWASAELAAHVDKFILENGYGCRVELVSSDEIPTIASMSEKGQPDVAPEVWMNSSHEFIDKAVKEGRLKIAGEILSDGGEEGRWRRGR